MSLKENSEILPEMIRRETIDFLVRSVKMLSVSLLYEFEDVPEVKELTTEQFRSIASQLKNSVYPEALVRTEVAGEGLQASAESCIELEKVLGGFSSSDEEYGTGKHGGRLTVRIWKHHTVELKGEFPEVLAAIPQVEKAISEAIRRSPRHFPVGSPEFYQERLDNIKLIDRDTLETIRDGLECETQENFEGIVKAASGDIWGEFERSGNSFSRKCSTSDGVNVFLKRLYLTMKLIHERHGASYEFLDNLDEPKNVYKIRVKLLVGTRLRAPIITVKLSEIEVEGGLPLKMFLDFRRELKTCFEAVMDAE